MSNSSNRYQEMASNMVLRTSDNKEILLLDLKMNLITNSFPHHLLPINYDEILLCEDQVKDLLVPSFITQLDLIQEKEEDNYESIISNIEKDVSKMLYRDVKANNLNNKKRAEESRYLLIDNDLKFYANINKLTEDMFILFCRQLELTDIEQISTYIQATKKLYRNDATFKLSLDLNVLRMVVTDEPQHLANIMVSSVDMDIQNQSGTNKNEEQNEVFHLVYCLMKMVS